MYFRAISGLLLDDNLLRNGLEIDIKVHYIHNKLTMAPIHPIEEENLNYYR